MDRSRESYETEIQQHPNITHKELAATLGCGPTTVARDLQRYGLTTRPWSQRRHSEATRQKLSDQRQGQQKGSDNPNFGPMSRPWLEGENHPFRRWHREHPEFGENQRGAANPVHKARHLYDDPEYVERITTGIRAHVDQKRGSTYEEVYGPEKAAARRFGW